MTRNQWIRKQQVVKPLLAYLRKQGYRVSFKDNPKGDWAFGWHNRASKTVCVYLRTPKGHFRSLADIVFVLAHEARHTEHIELGLFPKYYDRRRSKSAPHLLLMALAAERNCDLSARKYVDKVMPGEPRSELYNRKYPTWRVSPIFLPPLTRLDRIMRTTKPIKVKYDFRVIQAYLTEAAIPTTITIP